MENIDTQITVLSLVLFFGVALNRFSKFFKMPILLCFLGLGMLFGEHGMGLLPAYNMKNVHLIGEIAICFIMFNGGLQTSFKSIKSVFLTGTILATVGVILTALFGSLFMYWVNFLPLGFIHTPKWIDSLLYASVFASTDAAAVFAILRGQKASINPRLQNLLEYESGSNDPAAFLLTSIILTIACGETAFDFAAVTWNITTGIIWGLGAGTLIGLGIAVFGQMFYDWIHTFLEYNGLRLVVAIAIVLFCYGIAAMCKANVLMACYVAGISMGNMRFNYKHVFIKFHDGLSWLMQLLLFTILGSFFDYHMLFDKRNMLVVLLVSFAIMFIVRPLVVMLCMIKSPFTMRERIFTSWVGIRGSAPIMLAAMVASKEMNKEIAFHIFCGAFTLVLLSILIQGSSLMWVAKKLGLVLPYEEKGDELLEYDERPDGREIAQFTVDKNNLLANKKLMDFCFEGEAILLMVKRGKKYIQPSPELVLEPGDSLTFLGVQSELKQLQTAFFPEQTYSPSLTFRQIVTNFSRKMYVRRHKKRVKTT